MQSALYVALSAQVALERRMETISKNVANMNTVGYRADEISFETYLSRAAAEPVAFASAGETYISRETGAVKQTGNPLDVAVDGEAWMAIGTPQGTVYTRDGRMRMLDTGDLQTLNGYPILDVGNAPIILDPNGGPVQIARDGMITQGNQQLGAIGLFLIDPTAKLDRFENSGVIPDKPAIAALDFTSTGVVQGFVEGANVNPVMEMTKLIMVSRAFESASSMIQQAEAAQQEAIRTLGQTS